MAKFFRLGLPLVAAALFLWLVSPAFAAFTAPKKISTSSNNTILPQIVADNKGYLHLVWMEADNSWSSPNPGIFYSRWNGDSWSSPLKISTNDTGFADNPSLAADSQRRIHVVYGDDTGFDSSDARVRYTKRETDGTWSTPVTLPHPAGINFGWNPRIAVDTSDNLHVIYAVNDNPSLGGTFYYTSNDGTGWTTPVKVSYDTDGTTALLNTQWGDLFADKQGAVHAIFWDWDKGILYRKLSAGSWSTPFSVTSQKDVEFTRMTVDDDGNPWIAWFESADKSVRVRGQISGSWQTEETLKTGAIRSFWNFPILGISTTSKGVIAVGWGETGAGGTIDIAYRFFNGSTWSSPEKVRTDTVNSDTPWLFRDLWDNQHLVWTELNSSNDLWELYYSIVQGTQKTVGTAGGTVVSNIGGTTYATLNFPSSALSADTEITILIGPLPESVSPTVVTIPRAFTFGPHGLTFASPIDAVINYTNAELEGGDPQTLKVYIWDSQTNSYAEKTGTVNTTDKTITVSLDHFSLHAIAARKVETTFLESDELELGNRNRTLPVRFRLTYADNGEALSASEITADLKESANNTAASFSLEDGSIKHNVGNRAYLLNINGRELGLEQGSYTLEVYRSGSRVGSTEITVR